MARTLIEKLNEQTNNEFDYLKLSRIDVVLKTQTIEFYLLYPSDKEGGLNLYKDKITETIKRIVNAESNVTVRFKKSHFDFTFFKADLFVFLSGYPSLSNTLTDGDVSCEVSCDINVVKLELEKSVYDYCTAKKVRAAIEAFIDLNFCENIKVELISKNDTTLSFEEDLHSTPKLVLDNPSGRNIRPQNVEEFIGGIIYDLAGYIEDANKAKEGAVLCGTVGKVFEVVRKPKEGEVLDGKESEPSKTRRRIFKFMLTDFTSSINCVFFASQKNADQIGQLKAGKQIVCRGELKLDTFKNDGSHEYTVKEICLCTLPTDFVVNRLKRAVPEAYSVVFPTPYVSTFQASLFESEFKNAGLVAPYVLGKTFCVFDIETTGFNTDFDSIIEIGAIKLVDGIITETFSTFIDPKISIPARITTLTHITDAHVKGMPFIEDVLPDFFKFSGGTIMVGHNVQFDYSFISVKAKGQGIYFDNERVDTLGLARKYIPNLGKYKLENLVHYFNVTNKGAHRAIFDAMATAEVFLEIAKMIV